MTYMYALKYMKKEDFDWTWLRIGAMYAGI